MATSPSARERAFLAMAHRETDPAHWAEFQPITKGPFPALLVMADLALVVPGFIAWTAAKNWFRAAFGRRR